MILAKTQQMSAPFGTDVKTIGKHINNALKEELLGFSVIANFATTAADGNVLTEELAGMPSVANFATVQTDRSKTVAFELMVSTERSEMIKSFECCFP